MNNIIPYISKNKMDNIYNTTSYTNQPQFVANSNETDDLNKLNDITDKLNDVTNKLADVTNKLDQIKKSPNKSSACKYIFNPWNMFWTTWAIVSIIGIIYRYK